MSNKMKLNDNVWVIAGKDIGKKGQIISIDLNKNKVKNLLQI